MAEVKHIVWGQARDTAHTHASAHEARMCEENYASDQWEAYQEIAAERANERWFEERGGGLYAGSPEEARERFMESLTLDRTLTPREQRAADDRATADLEAVVYGSR